jgi:RNA polymerase sigma-70 factor, ECF subfamily
MTRIPLHIVEDTRRTSEDVAELNELELDLIRAAQQGDTSAFKQLYEQYYDRVYGLIYYSLIDGHQAEDALQTVFVKVFQALPFFRLESSFLTWIYRVALNECKNRNRRRKIFIPLSWISDALSHPDPAPTPDVVHASQELGLHVREAVMNLKPEYRTVVVLKYLEELSYEEISSILGCSPGTVGSRLNRALQILEERLRPLRSNKADEVRL